MTPQASQGLGLAAGRNLGAFVLRWRRDTATLDGSPARLIVSSDGGATWRELDADAAPDANDLIAWTRDAASPVQRRTLTVGVRIEAAIAPTSTLYLGREVQLDGAIDLSAVFL